MTAPRTGDAHRRLRAQLRATLVELVDDGVDYIALPVVEPPSVSVSAAAPTEDTSVQASEGPAAASVASTPASGPPPAPLPDRATEDRAASAVPAAQVAPSSDRAAALAEVRAELGDCQRCGLCETRQNIVFGEGNPEARVVFVGEGPGADEDRTGRPFVGRAGELLTKMIEASGWTRDQVYICNIVKCRPPGNRDPNHDEVTACRPFLTRQLEAIHPEVIISLGKPAASLLLGRTVAITRLRGQWQSWNGIPLMPTYHPAYLLRNYTRETRQAVWKDLQAVQARLAEAG